MHVGLGLINIVVHGGKHIWLLGTYLSCSVNVVYILNGASIMCRASTQVMGRLMTHYHQVLQIYSKKRLSWSLVWI